MFALSGVRDWLTGTSNTANPETNAEAFNNLPDEEQIILARKIADTYAPIENERILKSGKPFTLREKVFGRAAEQDIFDACHRSPEHSQNTEDSD